MIKIEGIINQEEVTVWVKKENVTCIERSSMNSYYVYYLISCEKWISIRVDKEEAFRLLQILQEDVILK